MTEIHHTPNTELFRKVWEQIREEPGSFDMITWENDSAPPDFWNWKIGSWEERTCDTTRCVAGWAVHLTDPTRDFQYAVCALYGEWGLEADSRYSPDVMVGARLLGLPDEVAQTLFLEAPDTVAAEVVELFAEGDNDAAFACLERWVAYGEE